MNLLGDLSAKGLNTHYVTGSRAFTSREIVGSRASQQIKYFNGYPNAGYNDIDVMVCDEAHSIRKTSNSRFTPRAKRSDVSQIGELINAISRNGLRSASGPRPNPNPAVAAAFAPVFMHIPALWHASHPRQMLVGAMVMVFPERCLLVTFQIEKIGECRLSVYRALLDNGIKWLLSLCTRPPHQLT
jgi:hypothetical protein